MSKILVICFSSINNVAMAIPVIHSLATQYAPYSRMCRTMLFSVEQISEENMPD